MNTNNKLGWIKKQFIEHNPDEIKEGYVFTIDDKPLEFSNFQPLEDFDVNCFALLHTTHDYEEFPPVACCTCGCIDCDSVRVFVEFIDNKVLWTLCHSRCETKESAMTSNLGKYTFLKEQYCQVINSLSDEIEKRGGAN